ncbi:Uncharacterised protein family (UPF0236) [Granulicatella balaenopterae]|uniref:Uncharacterized protein family (UPF0236) n=1 Tax=Granulicatella balaenopterae TaxID=137733 RepID=A0A1H9I283_9LACT|nr:ISLre2 family transposase [Granulicatella balaenopterae]SEQ68667.1 Uncharacterised protein family (UPF0236) [Granulicatella balaenopterae]
MILNEKSLQQELQQENIRSFEQKIKMLSNHLHIQLIGQGWKYVKTATRTVLFTFGEVTISRKCYLKNGIYIYPLDEELGLEKYTRFSKELLYEVAQLATKMSYRQVVDTFKILKNITITKDTVLKAVKLAGELYKKKKDYEYYMESNNINKKEPKILFLEGDGVRVKTNNNNSTDFSHFIIHEGFNFEYSNRKKLKNKHEIISHNNRKAREDILLYLENNYKLTKNTIIVSNSDMGIGYTPYVFREVAKVYNCKHEHFWDKYHLETILFSFKKLLVKKECIDEQLFNKLYGAINAHKKRETKLILHTIESNIRNPILLENFSTFSKRLLRNFQYISSAAKRHLDMPIAIGVMESQHTKITNRMKNRGMYWSVTNAETIAKMIIDIQEDQLDDLFFGKWINEYGEYEKINVSARNYVKNIKVIELPKELKNPKYIRKKFKKNF